jgi:histidinol-phosphatase
MIDPRLCIWDAAAALPIIREAGGRFSDWQGLERTDSGDAVAANPTLWSQLIPVTRAAKRL